MVFYHSPKSIVQYKKLVTSLRKKYKNKTWEKTEHIIVTNEIFEDICASIIDLQNRVAELEQEND